MPASPVIACISSRIFDGVSAVIAACAFSTRARAVEMNFGNSFARMASMLTCVSPRRSVLRELGVRRLEQVRPDQLVEIAVENSADIGGLQLGAMVVDLLIREQ